MEYDNDDTDFVCDDCCSHSDTQVCRNCGELFVATMGREFCDECEKQLEALPR